MSKSDKENELLKNWYENTVVEDQADCIKIAGMATSECLRRWNIGIGSDDEPEMVLGFYSVVFNTIIDELRNKRSDASEFAINIANVVEIGYDVFRKCRRLTDVYVDQPESDLLNKVGLPY